MPAILALVPGTSAEGLRNALQGAALDAFVTSEPARLQSAAELSAPQILLVHQQFLGDKGARERLGDSRWISVVAAGDPDGLDLDEIEALRVVPAELDIDALVRRLTLTEHGLSIGVQPSADLTALVCDVAQTPVLEIVRGLCRRQAWCELRLDGGVIHLGGGDVLAARSRKARAIKAFCRLARRRTGNLTVVLAEPGPREIGMGLDQLLLRALEDAQENPPDPRSALQLYQPGLHRAPGLLDYQRELLQAVEEAPTVGDVLDALPWPDGLIAKRLARLVEAKLVVVVKPRNAATVVTDSAADLPGRITRALGITVVPLTVQFGAKTYVDGVNITPSRFYELLAASNEHPRTQPPTADAFAVCFAERLADQDIVAVHLSSKLSQTVASATAGAAEVLASKTRPEAAIEVVDGANLSTGTGLLAVAAARMAERGLGAREIAERLRAMAPRVHTLFVVDTFDYLVRGGRVGAGRALVGRLLGIKPILGVVGGEIAAVDKARGGRAAHPKMIEILATRVDPSQPVVAAVAHAKAPVWADRLRTLLAKRFHVRECILTDIGPVIGTHAGPGAVGAAVLQPSAEEWPWIEPTDAEVDSDA
jgi:DegV family protein with EDD domain